MEIELIEPISERRARFELKQAQHTFANALRRAMMGEVPTLAVDYVKFYDNKSVLFDEMLALRLGLVPLRGDVDSYRFPWACECGGQGCSLCQLSLSLNAQCPDDREELTLYSRDLVSTDPEVSPAEPDIPIITLKRGQKVMAEAVARLGRGREHAKYQPTTVCGYKNRYRVVLGERCAACAERRCLEVCPRRVFAVEGGKPRVADEAACSYCKLCMVACEDVHGQGNAQVAVTPTEDVFMFTVETDGSLDAADVVLRAADVVKAKAAELSVKLAEI